ncbi:unnamed protein product, partial [Ixodes hexagonus]
TELKPLYDLLQKGTKWRWSRAGDNALNRSKTLLTHNKIVKAYDNGLMFNDPKKELGLVCDLQRTEWELLFFTELGMMRGQLLIHHKL